MPRLIPSPLHGRPMPVANVLRALAAQEGCDGPPWDQMQVAAAYIEELESLLLDAESLIDPSFRGAKTVLAEIRQVLAEPASP